jgi:hypothetical protein
VSFLEAEAPDLRPADAFPQATAVWDALVSARLGAAADAAHPELHQPSADDAEKLAARALDAPAPAVKHHRSALPAALAAEPPAAEPCKPDAARFAERSSAATEVQMEERPDEPQSAPQAARSPKPLAELLRPEHAPLSVVSPGVQVARPPASMPPEAQRRALEQLEPRVAQPPTLPEAPPPASQPEEQLPQVSLPEHAPLAAPSDAALPEAPQLLCAA